MPSHFIELKHFRQQWDGDCLATCADMVLQQLGKQVSRRRLRRLMRIREGLGTPFYNISRLEKLGVRVERHEGGTMELLKAALERGHPCIVSVKAGELPHWLEPAQHAVVVVGMSDKKVWIHDPEFVMAPIPVPIGDFDLAWLGMGERFAIITD